MLGGRTEGGRDPHLVHTTIAPYLQRTIWRTCSCALPRGMAVCMRLHAVRRRRQAGGTFSLPLEPQDHRAKLLRPLPNWTDARRLGAIEVHTDGTLTIRNRTPALLQQATNAHIVLALATATAESMPLTTRTSKLGQRSLWSGADLVHTPGLRREQLQGDRRAILRVLARGQLGLGLLGVPRRRHLRSLRRAHRVDRWNRPISARGPPRRRPSSLLLPTPVYSSSLARSTLR